MAYRQEEQAHDDYRAAMLKMTAHLPPGRQEAGRDQMLRIMRYFGPVVSAYPVWHPFITASAQASQPNAYYIDQSPSGGCGYGGIDHPVFFQNAILAVVYEGGLEGYLASLKDRIACHAESRNSAEAELEVLVGEDFHTPLYNDKATPVLLCCTWDSGKGRYGISSTLNGFIKRKPGPENPQETPLSYIMRNTMAWFMKMAERSQIAEDWGNVSSYVLGSPCGAVTSPFITEEVGFRLRSLTRALNDSGLFGPRLVYADDPKIQKRLVRSGQHATVSKID